MAARGASGAHRMILNRSTLDAITLATGDAMFEMTKAVVASADPPDATPFGVGLVTTGGVAVWVRGRKIAEWSTDGSAVKPPRAARVSKQGVIAIGGYGFPGRFQELGTVKQQADPFLTPALMAEQPNAGVFVKAAMARRLASKPGAGVVSAKIAAIKAARAGA